MSYEINGTVQTLSALVASSAETLHQVHGSLAVGRDPYEAIPAALGVGLLGDLGPAIVFIGGTIDAPCMARVCPADATADLTRAKDALGRAAWYIKQAKVALDGGNQPDSLSRATTHDAGGRLAGYLQGPAGAGDLRDAAISVSALVVSSAESLYRVQHGLNAQGPGRPVAHLRTAGDLLDNLGQALGHISVVVYRSASPDVCLAAARPHLRLAVENIKFASGSSKVARTKADAGVQPGLPSCDYPFTVTTGAAALAGAPRRTAGHASRAAARRTP